MAIDSSSRHSTVTAFQHPFQVSVDPSAYFAALCDTIDFEHNSELNPSNRGGKSAGRIPVNSSSSLVPEIHAALAAAAWSPSDIELVAVALGPGSFTGLRIGVVAAKTIAFATGCAVVGVNLMDDLAVRAATWYFNQHPDRNSVVVSVGINIGRGEVLASSYPIDRSKLFPPQPAHAATICLPGDWIGELEPGTLLTGNGLDLIDKESMENLSIVPDTLRSPTAASIGHFGCAQFTAFGGDDFWKLQPLYSRPSAAEEVRQKKA